ncbi:hypothetical protein MtrunA17_Chr6g0455021 [Medicago truncatula]|uniref:Uncharacterized protein n=1 Tax=Medicago truncatula TaxID=3880 RepID=A0A396HC60_MEDTR|nr:hypothetical protein MtrunA17_Chr6g0455021 [Medicago truncatula]
MIYEEEAICSNHQQRYCLMKQNSAAVLTIWCHFVLIWNQQLEYRLCWNVVGYMDRLVFLDLRKKICISDVHLVEHHIGVLTVVLKYLMLGYASLVTNV